MSSKYAVHPMERRAQDAIRVGSHGSTTLVPDAWRGNCHCGKWLVVLRVYTREKPLVCHGPCAEYGQESSCGRRWFLDGDEAKFEPAPPGDVNGLARFRADPAKVRVSMQYLSWGTGTDRWRAQVAMRPGGFSCARYGATPEEALEEALLCADRSDVEGIDLEMGNSYMHPMASAEQRARYEAAIAKSYVSVRDAAKGGSR